MTRGERVRRADVNWEMIRYYEKRGLLAVTRRNPSSGYKRIRRELSASSSVHKKRAGACFYVRRD